MYAALSQNRRGGCSRHPTSGPSVRRRQRWPDSDLRAPIGWGSLKVFLIMAYDLLGFLIPVSLRVYNDLEISVGCRTGLAPNIVVLTLLSQFNGAGPCYYLKFMPRKRYCNDPPPPLPMNVFYLLRTAKNMLYV